MARKSRPRGRRSRKQEDDASRRSSVTPLHVVLAVVGVAILLYLVTQLRPGGEAATEPVPITLDRERIAETEGVSTGDPDAAVEIMEFADFQCPACAQYATFIGPIVKARYVETGVARYTFYNFPLVGIFPNAFIAARASRCAEDQGRFWEYHDVLFARQGRWSGERDPTPRFAEYAVEAGLDRRAFDACLHSDRHAEVVTENMGLGQSLNVPGTPSIFIDGMQVPQEAVWDVDALGRMIEAAAGEDGPPPEAEPAG